MRNEDWACLLDDHLVMQTGAAPRHVYIGIATSRGTAQVQQQIELARERGARGRSIFSSSSITPEM